MTSLPKTYVAGFHDDMAIKGMKYKQLGNTDMYVSPLAFGGARLGDEMYALLYGLTDTPADMVREAIQQGVNYIDTAPFYSEGKSEAALGTILPDLPRESFYIATKVGRYKLDRRYMFNFTAEHVTKGFDKSLELLGLDYVDLLQVHDVEFAPNIDIIINETLPALDKIRKAGKARYLGITGYPLHTLKEIVERSTVKIDTVLSYCRCTLNDTELLDYIPFFREKGLGVINASPLSMGLFCNQGPMPWHSASEELQTATKQAINYCKNNDVDIARLAMKNCLSMGDQFDTMLTSVTSMHILEENLRTLRTPLTGHEQEVLDHIKLRFMAPLKSRNWEGVEVAKHWRKLEEIAGKDGALSNGF